MVKKNFKLDSMEGKEKNEEKPVRKECPPPEDLSVVFNDLQCVECNLHFRNLARFHMHNLKVHEKKGLEKVQNDKNVQYHCPVQNCIYAINCTRFFTQKRYLKQVRNSKFICYSNQLSSLFFMSLSF